MRNDYDQRADHDRDDDPTSVIAPPRDGLPHPRSSADDEETRVFDTGDPDATARYPVDSTVDHAGSDLPGEAVVGRSEVEEQAGWRPGERPLATDTTAVGQASVDDAMAQGAVERGEDAGTGDEAASYEAGVRDEAGTRDETSEADEDRIAAEDLGDGQRAEAVDAERDAQGAVDAERGDRRAEAVDAERDDRRAGVADADVDAGDRVAGERGADAVAGGDYRADEDPDRSAVDDRLTAADEGTFDSPADGELKTDEPAAGETATAEEDRVDGAEPPGLAPATGTPTTDDTTVTAPAATDETAASTGDAPAAAPELLPGDAPAAPVGAIWSDDQRQEFRDRWREVQLQFVDDPKAAAEQAQTLVNDAVDVVVTALNRQRDDLGGWQGADNHDTEELRVALRRYRDFLNELTK